jgi:hypothetical protein
VDVLCWELPLSRNSLEEKLFFGKVDAFCLNPIDSTDKILLQSVFSTSDEPAVGAALPDVAVLVQLLV